MHPGLSERFRAIKSDVGGVFKPFKTEFDMMLDLYPDDDAEGQKNLAESMKAVAVAPSMLDLLQLFSTTSIGIWNNAIPMTSPCCTPLVQRMLHQSPETLSDIWTNTGFLMSTFAMMGSLWLSAVWGVNGPDITVLHEKNVWGSFSGTAHTTYKALTTIVSILCILLVGTTARTTLLLDLIPHGGHKDAIKALGHTYIVALPYVMFGLILIMIGFCVLLQATLTNSAAVGSLIGGCLLFLSISFLKVWVWADRSLGATLKMMVNKRKPSEEDETMMRVSNRPTGIADARRFAAPTHASSRNRRGF